MTQQFGNPPESIRSQRSERNSHLCRRPLIGRHPVVRIAETRRCDAPVRARLTLLLRLEVVLEMEPDVQRAIWFLRLVLEVNLREREHDALDGGAPLGTDARGDARHEDVRHLDDEVFLLALAGLADRDRRITDVLTRGTRLHHKWRGLVDVMGEVEVVETRLACTASSSVARDAGLGHAPGPRQYVDLVLVLGVLRLTLDRADAGEDRHCHSGILPLGCAGGLPQGRPPGGLCQPLSVHAAAYP